MTLKDSLFWVMVVTLLLESLLDTFTGHPTGRGQPPCPSSPHTISHLGSMIKIVLYHWPVYPVITLGLLGTKKTLPNLLCKLRFSDPGQKVEKNCKQKIYLLYILFPCVSEFNFLICHDYFTKMSIS